MACKLICCGRLNFPFIFSMLIHNASHWYQDAKKMIVINRGVLPKEFYLMVRFKVHLTGILNYVQELFPMTFQLVKT